MRRRNCELKALVAIAAATIILMSAFSDFRPRSSDRFTELPDGQTVRVQCEVAAVRISEKGWVLVLFDFAGDSANGFLAKEDGPPPAVQTMVEAQGTWSSGSEMFFVRRWTAIEP
ncbi:MAG: hypothetical protein LUO85_00775 [Methanomassiliicoccales archaeon]|nr:hypothetical protein [Methanomassiliicoccales archaeon]